MPSTKPGRIALPQRPPVRACTSSNARQPSGQRSQVGECGQPGEGERLRLQQAPISEPSSAQPPRNRRSRPDSCRVSSRRLLFTRHIGRRMLGKLQRADIGGDRPAVLRRDPAGERVHRAVAVGHHVVEMLRRRIAAAGRCDRTAAPESRAARPCRCRRPVPSGRACSRCGSAAGRAAASAKVSGGGFSGCVAPCDRVAGRDDQSGRRPNRRRPSAAPVMSSQPDSSASTREQQNGGTQRSCRHFLDCVGRRGRAATRARGPAIRCGWPRTSGRAWRAASAVASSTGS